MKVYPMGIALVMMQAGAVSGTADGNVSGEVVDLPEYTVTSQLWQNPERIGTEGATASKFALPVMETPRSLAVITRQQMEDWGVGSVEESLLYLPGVYGATFGVDTRGDWSRVRGVAPQEFRDGLKSLFGFYNNTRPHPYTFERIEVVKGPSSVLYGQGTLGGVVNVVSKEPLPVSAGEVEFQYGSHEHYQVAADLTGPVTGNGELLYRVVGVWKDSGTQVDHVEADEWVLAPSLTWAPTEKTTLTFLGNFQRFDGGLTTQFLPLEGTLLPGRHIPTDTFVGEPGYDRYDTEQNALTVKLRQVITDQWRFEAKGRYTDSFADYNQHWPAYNGPEGGPVVNEDGTVTRTIYDSDHDAESWVGDARLIGAFGSGALKHQLAAGIDWQYARTDNDSYYGFATGGDLNLFDPMYGTEVGDIQEPVDSPPVITEQTGVYLNNVTRLQENWIFSYGARFDNVVNRVDGGATSIDEEAVSLDLGVLYHFNSGLSPYLNYADSFEPIAGTNVDGDTFEPREGRQYEAGIKYQPNGDSALYTVSAFRITEENRPRSAPGGAGQVQTGEVEIEGIELAAQQNIGDVYLQASYSYLSTEIIEGEPYEVGTRLSSVPEQQASAWATWAPSEGRLDGFRLGAGVRYVGKTTFTTFTGTTFTTPEYWLYDAMAAYRFGNAEVALNVQNLFDETYVTSAANASAFYGQRREVRLSLRYQF